MTRTERREKMDEIKGDIEDLDEDLASALDDLANARERIAELKADRKAKLDEWRAAKGEVATNSRGGGYSWEEA